MLFLSFTESLNYFSSFPLLTMNTFFPFFPSAENIAEGNVSQSLVNVDYSTRNWKVINQKVFNFTYLNTFYVLLERIFPKKTALQHLDNRVCRLVSHWNRPAEHRTDTVYALTSRLHSVLLVLSLCLLLIHQVLQDLWNFSVLEE